MKNTNKIIDDIAQLAGGAAGLLGGVQQQIRDDITTRVEDMASKLDLVSRDEFERLEEMVKSLLQRVDNLENKK